MKRISKDSYYINIAQSVSARSTCLKRQYGCVIVKDEEIIATGYNGAARGEPNCCDVYETCPRIKCRAQFRELWRLPGGSCRAERDAVGIQEPHARGYTLSCRERIQRRQRFR